MVCASCECYHKARVRIEPTAVDDDDDDDDDNDQEACFKKHLRYCKVPSFFTRTACFAKLSKFDILLVCLKISLQFL